MEMETSSIGGEADMCAGGGSFPEVIKREDTRARATVMEPLSSAEAMEPRRIADDTKAHGITKKQSGTIATCTSSENTCKGKYRINVKGPACHGQACCGGT